MLGLEPIQEICYSELNKFYVHYVEGAKKICVRKRRPSLTPDGILQSQNERDVNFDAYYDKGGKVLRAILYYLDGEVDFQLIYNSDGKLQSTKRLEMPTGEELGSSIYTYDSKGRPILKKHYSYDEKTGECDGEQTYKFAFQPNRILSSAQLDDLVELNKEVILDSRNRIIELKTFSLGNRFQSWITYFYEENGLLKRTEYKNMDGQVIETTFLEYTNNLFIKEIYKNVDKPAEDGFAEYRYQINDRGHFIEKTMIMENELKWIEDKVITYY
jgi:hypothetical protein